MLNAVHACRDGVRDASSSLGR
ncbi:MAG: hypothetical protein QOD57_3823, partial [Actinomycetota bacterium]|nr:hypothetical protein [Actinomycetota bacterium]